MKKKLIIVLSVFVVLALALSLFACGNKHEHDYGEKLVSDESMHWYQCLNDGCDEPKIEQGYHEDANQDGACDVCGRAVEVKVTGVELSDDEISLKEGETYRLTALVNPANATKHEDFKWTSENDGVAGVSQDGTVHAKRAGSTRIKVSLGKWDAYCTVNVNVAAIKVESVSLPAELTVEIGGIEHLLPEFTPYNADNKKVTWKSDDTEIASVNENGYVEGKKLGVVNITVTTEDGNKTAACKITVTQPVANIIISGDGVENKILNLYVGEAVTLTASVLPENASDKRFSWSTTDDQVVTIGEDGKLTAKGEGTAKVRATAVSNSQTDVITVNVTIANVPVEGVAFAEKAISLQAGETSTPEIIFTPANASNKKVTWQSSDESVITIDEDGKITPVSGGTATVTVTTEDGDFQDTCTVSVVVKVTGVTIEGDGVIYDQNDKVVYIAYGSSKQLVANVSPADATNKKVTWSVGTVGAYDEGVVVDEDGTVSFTEDYRGSYAYVTVTTEDGGFTDKCEIRQLVSVDSVSIAFKYPFSGKLAIGETKEDGLDVYVYPTNATNKNVTWKSSDENVVTVDRDGTLTAVDEGSAFVWATSEDGSCESNELVITVEHYLTFTAGQGQSEYLVSGVASNFSDSVVVIPPTYKGKPVVGISASAFREKSFIRGVKIPASVTTIGGNSTLFHIDTKNVSIEYEGTLAQWCAFENLVGLINNNSTPKRIVINCNDEENKIDLMDDVWYDEVLEIPDGVEHIGRYAFYNTTIRKINLPASLVSIDMNAFYLKNGAGLEIDYQGTLDQWVQIDGLGGAFYRDRCYLDVTVDGVKLNEMTTAEIKEATQISPEAFYNGNEYPESYVHAVAQNNESLHTVILSDSVTEIGSNAFKNCTALTTILIGSGMKKIYDTFSTNEQLSTVYYKGDEAAWESLDIPSYSKLKSTYSGPDIYFYSEKMPTKEGNFWHYDEDEKTPVVWNEIMVIRIESIAFEHTSLHLGPEEGITFKTFVSPADHTEEIVWKVSNDSCATVEDGKVVVKNNAPLNETFTVTASNPSEAVVATCEILVKTDFVFEGNVTGGKGHYWITGLKDGSPEKLVIPSEYKGKQVMEIKKDALYGLELKEVWIPNTVNTLSEFSTSWQQVDGGIFHHDYIDYIEDVKVYYDITFEESYKVRLAGIFNGMGSTNLCDRVTLYFKNPETNEIDFCLKDNPGMLITGPEPSYGSETANSAYDFAFAGGTDLRVIIRKTTNSTGRENPFYAMTGEVYYEGTPSSWERAYEDVVIPDTVTVYTYSADRPDDLTPNTSIADGRHGGYWHYDEDEKTPVLWS